VLAAPAAAADGWADVAQWLAGARGRFAERSLPLLSRRCEELLAGPSPNPWAGLGVSAREADVLRLVTEGLANKEIAARLHVSPRTIEKHVESLLRKAGARTRTELVARLSGGASSSKPRSPTQGT
jgi:DNA-binding NarL/FixJ family response regulator